MEAILKMYRRYTAPEGPLYTWGSKSKSKYNYIFYILYTYMY